MTKLTDWQNGIICEALGKIAAETLSPVQVAEARKHLTEEFLALNSQTDFQATPSEIPPEWLDAAVLASVRRVVDLHASRRIFD